MRHWHALLIGVAAAGVYALASANHAELPTPPAQVVVETPTPTSGP